MRKIFYFLLVSMILVISLQLASAYDFDNVKDYDETSRTITVKNSFLGVPTNNVATIQLTTPLNNYVIVGKDREVAEFNIDLYGSNYDNALKQMDYYNSLDGKVISRNINYKYKSIETYEVEVQDHSIDCQLSKDINETSKENDLMCENILIGTHIEIRERAIWNPLNKDLGKGNITIGLFTDVYGGDNVEWIPTFFGVQITEWAKYTAVNSALNYTFDNSANFGQDTGTITNADWTAGAGGFTSGINCIDLACGNSTTETTGTTILPSTIVNGSLSVWIRPSSNSSLQTISASYGGGTTDIGHAITIGANGIISFLGDGGGTEVNILTPTAVLTNKWTHYLFKTNDTGMYIFQNGTLVSSQATVGKGFFRGGSIHTMFAVASDTSFDEVKFYNVQLSNAQILSLYNNESQIGSPITISTTLNLPLNNSAVVTSQIFNASGTIANGNLTNATIYIWYQNGTLFNQVTNVTSGNQVTNVTSGIETNSTAWNVSGFGFGSFIWNTRFCGTNSTSTICSVAPNNFTFSSGLVNNSESYNASTYETAYESFLTNFTISAGYNITSATLVWNGTSYSANYANNGASSIAYYNGLIIPNSIGTKNWYWNLIINSNLAFSTTAQQQFVNQTNFTFCAATPQNVPYVNFTFKNETAGLQSVNATLTSTWTYWLGDGSVNKTLSYNGVGENPSYAFCGNPGGRTFNVLPILGYANSYSTQRTYQPISLSLTNTTLNQILYLLPNSVPGAQPVSIQVETIGGSLIANANVNISRSGFGDIASKVTDSSGIAAFFLDPTVTYTVTVTASGYSTSITTVTPTQTLYRIILGGTSSTNVTDYARGIAYFISPTSTELNNNTAYDFNFTITSSYNGLSSYGFTLTNTSGTILGSASGSTSSGSTVSVNFNTGNQSYLIMNYYYVVNGTNQAGSHSWIVVDLSGSGWSIGNFFTDLQRYLNDSSDSNGLFGLKTGTSNGNFSLALIIFLVIFCFAGIMNFKYGLSSPSAVLGIMFTCVLFFDVALGIIPNPVGRFPHFPTYFMGLILIREIIREASN